MKKFENPMIEIDKFSVMDVITTSACTDYDNSGCPDETWKDLN